MDIGFLIELGWKSALIAGAALVAVTCMRGRAPADRAAVLKLAVALLLLLPAGAALVPHLEVEAIPASPAYTPAPMPVETALPAPRVTIVDAADPGIVTRGEEVSIWPSTEAMLAMAYLAGLLLIALRLGAGLVTLRRWTRAADPADCPHWEAALARHAVPGRPEPRLLVSGDVPGPLSWGSLRPVILLDVDSFFRPEDADAIVAHEMAHLARGDWRMLVFARAAVALFWFNPIVWLLEREVVQQAEEAADAYALREVEATAYAQTLLTCARHRSSVPANSIAGSSLRRRVARILEGRGRASPGSRWTLAAMIGCVAFATPVAALELVEARRAPEPPQAPAAPQAPDAAPPPAAPLAPLAAVLADVPDAPEAPDAPAAPPAPHVPPVPPAPEIDEHQIGVEIETAMANAHVEIERSVAMATAIAAHATQEAMRGIAHGAFGMEAGAKGMEEGARQMERQAALFRKKDYREKLIADARARGETVTHAELLEAADEMKEGAEEMRQGAEEMRDAAREMQAQAG